MHFFAGLSLRVKLFVLCAFLSSVSVLIAATGFSGLRSVASSYGKVSDRALPNLNALNSMYLSYQGIRIHLRTLGLPGLTKAQADEAVKGVHAAIAAYEEKNKEYAKYPFEGEQRALYERLNEAWGKFVAVGGRALAHHAAGTPADQQLLLKIFLEDCPAAAGLYNTAVINLRSFHLEHAHQSTLEAKNESAGANWLMGVLSLAGVVVGATFGYLLARGISNSIALVVAELNRNAAEVNTTSAKIASYSESLSQSTMQQAASLQETAASLEEISAMITKASTNATGTSDSSLESQRKAQDGRESMKEMLGSMEEINASNDEIMAQITESNQRVAAIVSVIEEIGAKTRVINDIVFQTKLLSFNASVEAARAGEHGKGFAVVAEEVGNLAQMSGNAAKEISALLEESNAKVNSIVAETKTRVDTILGKGKLKVNEGVRVAENCSTILDDIVHNVSEVSNLAQEIATASKEQSQGVGEINKAMAQLDSVSQSNASASQNTAAAADELTAQADSLRLAVSNLERIITGSVTGAVATGNVERAISAGPTSAVRGEAATAKRAA